jgi:hypothetical protein
MNEPTTKTITVMKDGRPATQAELLEAVYGHPDQDNELKLKIRALNRAHQLLFEEMKDEDAEIIKQIRDEIIVNHKAKNKPPAVFMSIETFHRLRNLIQHSTSPEQNTYTYGGRLISIVSKKTIHDCSEHTMSDGTCAVCGKEQLP